MNKFKSQLDALLVTLKAVTSKKSFDIEGWYHEVSEKEAACGFAACICGHEAASGTTPVFENIRAHDKDVTEQARQIAFALKKECRVLFGATELAKAIFSGCSQDRFKNACESGLFTSCQLRHPHLHRASPTLKQAISFLELASTKVDKRLQELELVE